MCVVLRYLHISRVSGPNGLIGEEEGPGGLGERGDGDLGLREIRTAQPVWTTHKLHVDHVTQDSEDGIQAHRQLGW